MASARCCPVWRGHSCLRGSARADRNVCPTLPRSIAATSPARRHPSCAGAPLPEPPRHATTSDDKRRRLASGRQTPYSMTISRPFRARQFLPRYPGRCPGLVYHAPSGLSSALSQAAFRAHMRLRSRKSASSVAQKPVAASASRMTWRIAQTSHRSNTNLNRLGFTPVVASCTMGSERNRSEPHQHRFPSPRRIH